MRWLLFGGFGLLAAVAMVPCAIIAFNPPALPPPMASMAAPLQQVSSRDYPTPRQFQARDGASLQYYAYPAEPDKVAVLVHGTAGPGTSMHPLAASLRAAGVTTYVLDIRGHGGSGRRGDIDYIGQIDDDLADFVHELGPAQSGVTRTLVGFSGGAGFTVRFAGGPNGLLFDRYVFLAPIFPGALTWRPSAGGWINISVPRIATIVWLDRLGIHWFDGFPVISYAVSPDRLDVTASYSYRLLMNFGAGRRYETDLRNLRRPAMVFVGDADEQVVADQFTPLFQRLGVNIPVTIIQNMKHRDMIAAPETLQMVVRAISHADALAP
jgi:alpha-beta hydrolase superfamily lysophospholipase